MRDVCCGSNAKFITYYATQTMTSLKKSKLKAKEERCSISGRLGKTRKQIRKELRKQKKVARALYSKKRNEFRARAHTERYDDRSDISRDANDAELSEKVINERRGSAQIVKNASEKKYDVVSSKRKRKKNELLNQANLKEDKIIKQLEKKLKLNKKKKKTIPKSFAADGLDDLLDFCLEENRDLLLDTEREFVNKGFDEDEAEEGVKCVAPLEEKTESTNDYSSDASGDENSFEASNGSNVIQSMEIPKIDKIETNDLKEKDNVTDDDKGLWEDIYGRKRDKQGNIVPDTTKYIPPAARVTLHNKDTDDEKLCSLKRHLKGYLNRVTEQNIHYISTQIEAMYMENSRGNMNHVLSDLVLESLATPVLTPGRLICEHMMLIAILHANIGIEVGANFLEKLVKNMIEKMKTPQDVENKELDNMILMISHLYNFRVYGHKLLYQILNKLMMEFTEKEIELILLLLKTVGFSLRKDDPNALKEFIQNLQSKAKEMDGTNSRVKFMLDILIGIKNNNINKIPQYDPSHVEHLKKIMKSVIRKGNAVVQFNVSLDDLLHAEENGKWWIIGSAWAGANNTIAKADEKVQSKLNFGKKILELASKQRMNTDTRKNIFCILMTAEDYLDAFEKLHHLGLKDQQEGEIIHVLMHCCLQEKKFNPYYAVLAKKLCEYNRKYQLTIQYTFWDKLRSLESYGSKQLSNLAKFLIHLLIEKCLPLSILKIIQFTELDKPTMKFVKQIVMEILLHENEQTCLEVFEKVSVSPQLHVFRESLRLFISCFLIKNIDSYDISDEEKTILKRRADLVDKTLISSGSKFIF